jgi:hypothetical protein
MDNFNIAQLQFLLLKLQYRSTSIFIAQTVFHAVYVSSCPKHLHAVAECSIDKPLLQVMSSPLPDLPLAFCRSHTLCIAGVYVLSHLRLLAANRLATGGAQGLRAGIVECGAMSKQQ